MHQLLYVSSKTPGQDVKTGDILTTSRRNNAAAGVSGLLYAEGNRFLQVLEGSKADVMRTFARIKTDPRHRAVVILSDRDIENREFGQWAMAHREANEDADDLDRRLAQLLANASPSVRATFTGLIAARRAA